MKSVCVFCGSSFGNNPVYKEVAKQVGILLGSKGIRVIYGGGNVGLMGTVADAAIQAGGEAIGVIPHFLANREVAHYGLTELILVQSMHERKNKMAELSDGFISLPGGIGTLEELFEIFSWDYLQLHSKPVAILNTNGFYDLQLQHLKHTVAEGFLKQTQLDRLLVANEIEELLQMMNDHYTRFSHSIEKDFT